MKKEDKKRGKLLSAVLALCMLVGLTSIPAMAASQSPLPTATITVSKTFTVDAAINNSKITSADFTLSAVSYTGAFTGTAVPMPGTVNKTATLTASGTTATGSVAFDAISYSIPGIYTYKLVETVTTPVPGVTYDLADRFVNVYVTNKLDSNNQLIPNGDGTYHVEVSAITVWEGTNATLNWNDPNSTDNSSNGKTGTGTVDGNGNGSVSVAFTNTFGDTAGNTYLAVDKTVSGSLGNANQEFAFTLNTNSANILAYQVFDAANAPVSGVNKAGTIANGGKFNLKHNEYVRIYNLKDGDQYTITEDNSAIADAYKTSVTGLEGGIAITGISNVMTGTKSDGTHIFKISAIDSQSFDNNKGITPPTGVVVDILPFVLMVLIAGVGIFAMINKKRRVSAN